MGKQTCGRTRPKESREQVVKLMQAGDRSVRAVAVEFGMSAYPVRCCVRSPC